jgi:fatty acid desaturase
MTRGKHDRLRVPASSLVFGTGIALAVSLGDGWPSGLFSEMVTLCGVTILYFAGGGDTDAGAVLGGRPDERQKLVRLKAANLSLAVALTAMVGACVIAAAARTAFWPYEPLAVIIGVAYLIGLGVYGVDRDDPNAEVGETEDRRVTS